MNDGAPLSRLAALAREAGANWIAAEAEALAERVTEGRFYVVCVGQFKRGKSTLLNALIGAPVLPTGLVPITTAVTVVRHGERWAARVRFRGRDWEECDLGVLSTYVSEEHNPGNEKDVTAVEVFAPSGLLRSGMCLVDTPGLGSVSLASTEATRAFVPHVDAALVVLGADRPITGEELRLLQRRRRNGSRHRRDFQQGRPSAGRRTGRGASVHPAGARREPWSPAGPHARGQRDRAARRRRADSRLAPLGRATGDAGAGLGRGSGEGRPAARDACADRGAPSGAGRATARARAAPRGVGGSRDGPAG